ncbi:MAG: 7TM-DISM domain-containing protein [Spirosomataceae bacterium]
MSDFIRNRVQFSRWISYLIFLGISTWDVSGQKPIPITPTFTTSTLEGYVGVSTYKTWETKDTLDTRKNYQIMSSSFLNLGYTSRVVWGQFSLKNTSDFDKELILQFRKSFVDTLILYQREGNQLKELGKYHWQQTYDERPYPNISPSFQLNIPKDSHTQYVFKAVKKNGSWHLIPNLYSKAYFEGIFNKYQMIQLGILIGFFFLGFVFTLSFYFLSWNLVFLFYSFYQIAFILFFLTAVEIPYYFLGDVLPFVCINEFASSYYQLITYFFYATFTFYFFRLNQGKRSWIQFLYFLYGSILFFTFLCILLFGSLFMAQDWFHQYLNFLSFFLFVFIFGCIIYGFRNHISETKLYVIAQLPILFLSIFWSLSNLSFISKSQNFTFIIAGSFLLENLLMFIALTLMLRNYFRQKEKDFTKQIVDVLEVERSGISMNLHDELGGNISTIKRKIEYLLDKQVDSPELSEELKKTYEIISETAKSLRRISHNLAPPELSQVGLVPSLSYLCKTVSGPNLQINFYHLGEIWVLPHHVELNLYRIITEAIQNIQKHANANLVEIQLTFFEEELNIIISDNGKWKAHDGSGAGLKNMEQRVKYIGGRLAIESSPTGTQLIVELKNVKR